MRRYASTDESIRHGIEKMKMYLPPRTSCVCECEYTISMYEAHAVLNVIYKPTVQFCICKINIIVYFTSLWESVLGKTRVIFLLVNKF